MLYKPGNLLLLNWLVVSCTSPVRFPEAASFSPMHTVVQYERQFYELDFSSSIARTSF